MSFFHSNETDEILSLADIRKIYEEYHKDEYEFFSDYLSACMYWHNGDLMPLNDYINVLNRRLNLYDTETDTDEITALSAEIRRLESLL